VAPSQFQQRDFAFEPVNNNVIKGDVFIDQYIFSDSRPTFNKIYDVNGRDNNPATLYDNDIPLPNSVVIIRGPLGTYTTTANSVGRYQFSNLPSGVYLLFKQVGPNLVPHVTLDPADLKTPDLVVNTIINISNDKARLANSDNKDYNYTYVFTNGISVVCYEDKDLNGQITFYPDSNTSDAVTSACSFAIENTTTGEIIPADYYGTSSAKSYLPPGNYILRNTNNPATTVVTNLNKVSPNSVSYGPVRQAAVSFVAGNINQGAGYNMFINIQPTTNNASIIGQVYIDRNGNLIYQPDGGDNIPGTKDDNDNPLKGVRLDLTGSGVNTGVNKTTTTDANGNYQITDLPAGPFVLKADLVQN